MPATNVSVSQKSSDELPEWSAPYALLMEAASLLDILEGVSQRLRVVREGGYTGIDIVPVMIGYLTSGMSSIKTFSARSAPHREELAALAGRREFPGSSSISRYLSAAPLDVVEPFVSWLIADSLPLDALQSDACIERDRNGENVRFFDWDPKVLTFRQRGLPEAEDMPAASRRSDEAAAGYPGRKRGNVQFSRSLIQHTASGHFVGLKTSAGNGFAAEFCQHALESVASISARCGWTRSECVIRMDGAFGTARILSAFQRMDIGYLTRLSSYSLLADPEVAQWMADGQWEPVRDSGSGPPREALDLGYFEFTDETTGEVTRTRVVVSRYQTDHHRGCGRQLESGVHELFAVSRDESAWGAAEVVEHYYARAGAENLYAQVDRELQIDRTFSYRLPGQHLVTGLALWIWNLQTLLGYRMNHPPCVPREQDTEAASAIPERTPTALDSAVESWVDLPVDWQEEATRRGFRWDPENRALMCERGKKLSFYRIRGRSVEFRGTKSNCNLCPIRGQCSSSSREGFRKVIRMTVASHLAPAWMQETSPASPKRIRPPSLQSGPYQPQISRLSPAALRKQVRQSCWDVAVRVRICEKDEKPPPRDIRKQRQRRRLNWTERHDRNALYADLVSIDLRISQVRIPSLGRLLDAISSLKRSA